jgi:hypothetical protein
MLKYRIVTIVFRELKKVGHDPMKGSREPTAERLQSSQESLCSMEFFMND